MAFRISKETLIGGIARINVGPDRIPFEVHKKVLCEHSPFFKKQFKKIEKSNNATDEIDIPQFDPDIFIEVINWMYKGELDLAPGSSVYQVYDSVCALGKIGSYLKMADLQRAAVSQLDKFVGEGFGDEFLAQAEERGFLADLESSSSGSEESSISTLTTSTER